MVMAPERVCAPETVRLPVRVRSPESVRSREREVAARGETVGNVGVGEAGDAVYRDVGERRAGEIVDALALREGRRVDGRGLRGAGEAGDEDRLGSASERIDLLLYIGKLLHGCVFLWEPILGGCTEHFALRDRDVHDPIYGRLYLRRSVCVFIAGGAFGARRL